jgi:hypothetical protein
MNGEANDAVGTTNRHELSYIYRLTLCGSGRLRGMNDGVTAVQRRRRRRRRRRRLQPLRGVAVKYNTSSAVWFEGMES